MAIYQYYLAAVPRAGLIAVHTQIPDRIGVRTETVFFKSDVARYWQRVEVHADSIVAAVDALLPRASWGAGPDVYAWKRYAEGLDHDAALTVGLPEACVQALSFRADLREPGLVFLKAVIGLAAQQDWLLMDRQGVLAEPDFSAVAKRVVVSDNFRFLQDPLKFLGELP